MDWNLIAQYVARAIALLIAIPVHESAHAWAAWKLGDPTAKNYGRMSLDPRRHFDPLGAIFMIFVGFGWAKPVPIAATQRFKNPKRDMALSAAAGPASNIILAFVCMIIYKCFFYACVYSPQFATITENQMIAFNFVRVILQNMVSINIVLAVFNMLPIPPLDGSRIAMAVLPQRTYFSIMRYERYIMFALFALVFFGFLDVPLSFLVNGAWSILLNITQFVEVMFGVM